MLNGLSWIYGKIMDARNALYNRGVLKAKSLPARTISIGNITVGGTGKTPLVAYISRYLANKGEKVCIISRGYSRKHESKRVLVSDSTSILTDPAEAGDEPFELAKRLLGKAVVIADRDRVAAAEWAYEEFGVTTFVLDDAFQHRRAARDLDIVVIDATNPFGNLRLLPSGVLREPPNNLSRADIAVVTRSDLCGNIGEVENEIKKLAPQLPLFKCVNKTQRFVSISKFYSGEVSNQKSLESPAFAFCGIGNPQNFFAHLAKDNMNLVESRVFPDHHTYTAGDIKELENEALKSGAEILITTAKDAVKLVPQQFLMPCYVCETELEFSNEKRLAEVLRKASG